LIFRKIIEIIATICRILKIKCPDFISAGAPLQTPLGELRALPYDLAGFKGPTSNVKEGRKDGREGQGKRDERER